MILTNFKNFLNHAELPKRAWQGHAHFRWKIIVGKRLDILVWFLLRYVANDLN